MLLQVPGLPEGRPALVLGDNVFLRSAEPPLPALLRSSSPHWACGSAVLLLTCPMRYELPMAPFYCILLHIACASRSTVTLFGIGAHLTCHHV